MQRDEIDVMWQQALRDSVNDGEMFTRYHFAEMVAAREREACAKRAKIALLGTLKTTSDRVLTAIRNGGKE
jgi:hypothetical protein